MKVLIIDDDPAWCALLDNLCQEMRYESMHITNAKEFSFETCDYDPDLVVMDIMMPQMDAYELLEKEQAFLKNASIYVCSGNEEQFGDSVVIYGQELGLNMLGATCKTRALTNLIKVMSNYSERKAS